MNDLDLARRAVACRGWRWMPGMLVMSDPEAVPRPVQMPVSAPSALRARVNAAHLGTWYGVGEYDVDAPDWEGEPCGGGDLPGTLPDLTDPATLGCLLALVREAWGVASVVYLPRDGAVREWRVVTYAHGADWLTPARLLGEGPTEAAALVAALEAAP